MDVSSKIPVKLATGETLEGLDSLRLVALSSGIGLDVDNRSPRVLVMDFSGMSSQGKMVSSSSLASKEISSSDVPRQKVVANNSRPILDYETTPKTYQPVQEPQSSFSTLIEENKNAGNKSGWKSLIKGHNFSFFKRKASTLKGKKSIKNDLNLQPVPVKFGTKIYIKMKQIVAHSIDICIVFNFSLLVVCLLSMLIWGIYPSDIISSPIVEYILQMRWIEFMFWIYVAFFIYRYLLRHLIGSTLGSKLCFGRITKTKATRP